MPRFTVRRKVFGLTLRFDSNDHPFVFHASRRQLEQGEGLHTILPRYPGMFWDVGANAGIYSLFMASLGNRVIAFDCSPKACDLINASAKDNALEIRTVANAFSYTHFAYPIPMTASPGNSAHPKWELGVPLANSITYLDAAAKFGIPDLIKMDIEGHEEGFLTSPAFAQWLQANQIALVIELHKPSFHQLLRLPHWELSSRVQFQPGRYLITNRTTRTITRVRDETLEPLSDS